MLSRSPHALTLHPDAPPLPVLEAPDDLVARYVELSEQRRRLEAQLAHTKSELELLAASALTDETPRARFVAPGGQVAARLYPTCTFDRPEVCRVLQRMGRLSDVAQVSAPTLARLLAKDPQLQARLKGLVRLRKGVVLMAGGV